MVNAMPRWMLLRRMRPRGKHSGRLKSRFSKAPARAHRPGVAQDSQASEPNQTQSEGCPPLRTHQPLDNASKVLPACVCRRSWLKQHQSPTLRGVAPEPVQLPTSKAERPTLWGRLASEGRRSEEGDGCRRTTCRMCDKQAGLRNSSVVHSRAAPPTRWAAPNTWAALPT